MTLAGRPPPLASGLLADSLRCIAVGQPYALSSKRCLQAKPRVRMHGAHGRIERSANVDEADRGSRVRGKIGGDDKQLR
jgi:hypothetical protein